MKRIMVMMMAVMMAAAMVIGTASAGQVAGPRAMDCGSYATLYSWDGDSHTRGEYITIYGGSNPRAVFYIVTDYGEMKLVKPLKNDGRTYAWQVKFANGEFYNSQTMNRTVVEADKLLSEIH